MEHTEEKQENKKIRQTKRELFWEIFRFLLVGGLATVVDYVVSALFHGLVLPPKLIGETWSLIVSTALGFSAGLLVNWFLSLAFVFKAIRDKKQASSKKSFLVYCVICLIGLAITLLGMDLFTLVADGDNHLIRGYSDDGIHLNYAGLAVWTDLIKPYLDR